MSRALRELAPDVVVDASGPFQSYGHDPYRVVAGRARGFHQTISTFRTVRAPSKASRSSTPRRARAAIFVLSGVSSFPVLTRGRRAGSQATWRASTP